MATIEIDRLVKKYGQTAVVHGIDLAIQDGEFVVLVGPSGCGKSTTLRMIAGLEEISGGQIRIDGRVVNDLQPKDRNIAMVFQNYAIYPHVTVADNIAFGLYRSKLSKSEKRARVEQVAQTLGLSHLLERRPSALSGGQWSAILRRSCSMSLFPISMLSCARRCASRSSGFITGSAPRPCS